MHHGQRKLLSDALLSSLHSVMVWYGSTVTVKLEWAGRRMVRAERERERLGHALSRVERR